MKIYKTQAGALKRQQVLTRNYGICPGVVKGIDGCYHLLYDPWDMA